MDVSSVASLKKLDCNYNKLKYLNLTDNRNLRELYCDINMLTSLDLSGNLALKILDCNSNENLSSLNLTENRALEELNCTCNNLSELDVSSVSKLKKLSCHANRLSVLDLSAVNPTEVCCGSQTSDGSTAQNLKLILTREQIASWTRVAIGKI